MHGDFKRQAMNQVPLPLTCKASKFPSNAFSPALRSVDFSHRVKTKMYTEPEI